MLNEYDPQLSHIKKTSGSITYDRYSVPSMFRLCGRCRQHRDTFLPLEHRVRGRTWILNTRSQARAFPKGRAWMQVSEGLQQTLLLLFFKADTWRMSRGKSLLGIRTLFEDEVSLPPTGFHLISLCCWNSTSNPAQGFLKSRPLFLWNNGSFCHSFILCSRCCWCLLWGPCADSCGCRPRVAALSAGALWPQGLWRHMGQAGVGRVNISWLFSVDVGQQVEDKHPSFLTLLGILGVKREGRDIQDRKLLLLALEGVYVCVYDVRWVVKINNSILCYNFWNIPWKKYCHSSFIDEIIKIQMN